ncbi:MAG: hypothetical protein Ta2B_12030 [Termitinemataceae bacterium]|nr:MAG: hypothetical protein Ta2B_12030 [Termitinemataceae bacterium]
MMDKTLSLFENRKTEINFYFSTLNTFSGDTKKMQTCDNEQFLRILKSNFILMLYNLVEACIVSGLLEIYESLKNSFSEYTALVDELQTIWSNHKIGEIYSGKSGKSAYENKVKEIIKQVVTNQPIILTRETLKISGNLDARKIKSLCDKHRIRYTVSDDKGYLKTVKDKRNSLAHGDESFGDCTRDMSLNDLEQIKNGVIEFITQILNGMKEYHDNKCYLRKNEEKQNEVKYPSLSADKIRPNKETSHA